MPKRIIRVGNEVPLLDIASYGRRGPSERDRLTPGQVAQIARTVRRVPEAVVKILPKGANNLSSVGRHLNYIGRHGELELETDDGEKVKGKGVEHELMEAWDLDLDEHRRQSDLVSAHGRQPPKLVHKLMLSMPPGTSPQGVLTAARSFLREEFALKHRYAFVLHTNEPHPHVHAVIKAVNEDGVRLHIRKATLREWRREFARHLRAQGIPANATERAVRGQCKASKRDGIFRAGQRGASTHFRRRNQAVAGELLKGNLQVDFGREALLRTRKEVRQGWLALGGILFADGERELAGDVRRYVAQLPPPRTEKEQIATDLLEHAHKPRVRDPRPSR